MLETISAQSTIAIYSACFAIIALSLLIYLLVRISKLHRENELSRTKANTQQDMLNQQHEQLMKYMNEQRTEAQSSRERFDAHQLNSLKTLQEALKNNMQDVREQVTQTLTLSTRHLGKQVEQLTKSTHQQLTHISGQVDKRLSEGFEKTTNLFTDVVKRLALIDQAQKKITELSSNVVSLQEVLNDKQSRGIFGEVQLSSLIKNVMPPDSYSMQHTLSNGKRADCMLFLPEPTGHIVIDAKFPLEAYRQLANPELTDAERIQAQRQFKRDIQNHIEAITQKYIIENETAEGAMMFIPAEAIFAEIHAHHPELVEKAHAARVWLVSPTTMMAILTTARAVLKDTATRQQVHLIQQHLVALSKDFERFQKRMDNLAKHMQMANTDLEQVHLSSKKISKRFQKIEKVDIPELESLDDNK